MLVLVPADADARRKQRNAKSVKQEQRATAKAIEKAKSDITQNDQETRRQLNRLNSLSAEIDSRSRDIDALKARIAALDRRLKTVGDSITALQGSLGALKTSYGKTLRDIRRRRQAMNDFMFVFSSESFNQAYRRVRYLRQLDRWQKTKASQIAEQKAEVEQRRAALEGLRRDRAAALTQLSASQKALSRPTAGAPRKSFRRCAVRASRSKRARREQAPHAGS